MLNQIKNIEYFSSKY